MSKKSHWFASNREEQLAMAREWQGVFSDSGAAWGIPSSGLTGLAQVVKDAEAALDVAKNETTRTPVATAQVAVETYLAGRHELGVRLVYVIGNPADPANKGYRIWYSVIGQGETVPEVPADLRKSFFTKRKKDLIEFDYADSGKTAYFAVKIENDGKKGSWGPLGSALIP